LAGLVLSLPSLAIILTAGFFGWLSDKVDRRTLLPAAMVLYALGGASGLLASTMTEILAGRIVLGIGVAGVMTLVTKLAADLWAGADRARFLGWQAAAMSGGGIIFLLAGGSLAELTWRGPFAIYALALPLAVVVIRVLPGSPATTPNDQGAGQMPWSFMVGLGAVAFFGMVMFYVVPTRLPFLLTDIGVTAPTAAGVAIAGMTAAGMPGALLFGRIKQVLSHEAIFALSFALMAAGYGIISQAQSLPMVIAGTLTAGLGLGPLIPNQTTWLMSRIPVEVRGRAAGLLTTVVFAGQFASPLVAGVLATRMGMHEVFLVFAVLLGLSSAAMLTAGRYVGTRRKAS
ncbi:MAG: MFS transporter, partial [Pseudomonadota bacterium]